MKGLFSRVFVSVWVAMAALAATLLVIDQVQPEPEHRARRENLFAEAVRREGMEVWAVARSAPDGEARAVARIRRFEDTTDAALFILRPDGTALGARPPSRSARQLAQTVRAGGNRRREKDSAHLIGFAMADGAVGVARVRRRVPWLERIGLTSLGTKLLAVFVLSGLLSWLLARMWIRPLKRLRQATRRLADGDLDTRVADDVRSAAELQTLAAEFDTMAERVQALVQGKERLLADVSHELNSPLARLRVALELARRKAGPDSGPALDRIEREATRLGALVEGILASARSDAESRGPVELVGQLRRVVEDARYENERVRVELEVPVEALHVEADAETLHRAVENVVRNAVAFSPEGRAVVVRLQESPGEVEIAVRDRGPGVPEVHLDAIFEPLFRVDPDRDRASGARGWASPSRVGPCKRTGAGWSRRTRPVEGCSSASCSRGSGLSRKVRPRGAGRLVTPLPDLSPRRVQLPAGAPDLELVRGLLCVPNVHAASLDARRSPLLSPLSVVCDDLRIGHRLVHALGCPDAPVFALDSVEDSDLDGTRRLILWVSNPPLALLRDRIRRSRPMRRVVMVAPPHRTALFKLGAAEGVPVVGCPSSIEALAERLTSQLGLRRDTPLPAPVRAVTPIPPPPRVSSDQLLGELERSLRRRLGPSAALEMARPDTLSFLVEKAAEAAIGQLRQSPGSALVSLDDPDDDADPRGWVPGSSGWYRRPTEEAPDAPTAPWPALAPAAAPAPTPVEAASAPAAPTPAAPAVSTAARTPRRPWLRRLAVVLSAVAGVCLALGVHHSFESEIESWLQAVSAPTAVPAAPVPTPVAALEPVREVIEPLAEAAVEQAPTEAAVEQAPTEVAPPVRDAEPSRRGRAVVAGPARALVPPAGPRARRTLLERWRVRPTPPPATRPTTARRPHRRARRQRRTSPARRRPTRRRPTRRRAVQAEPTLRWRCSTRGLPEPRRQPST